MTETDQLAQDAIFSLLQKRHPDHNLLGEEDTSSHNVDEQGNFTIPQGVTWIIDPVDGTTNFATDLPFFCVSVGVAIDGEPVAGVILDPVRDELFAGRQGQPATLNGIELKPVPATSLENSVGSVGWAYEIHLQKQMINTVRELALTCRTVRALGSAALSLGYVAADRLQSYVNFGMKPWDVCAGIVIVRSVGGEVLSPDGTEWKLGQPAFVVGHPALLEELVTLLKT